MKKIELEIVALSHSLAQTQNYAIVLGESNGVRRLPIVIGEFEAQSIAVAMEGLSPSRPMTHDLFKNTLDGFKIEVKEVVINNPATSIDVHLTANTKDISNIQVLYKFKKASSQENFEDIDWVFFNGTGQPDTLELATSENSISSVVEKQSSYQDLKYSVSDLEEFSSFAIKIVMKGVDPSYVPKIQDIRAVASF